MRIFKQLSIHSIETISKEIITLSDIRTVEVQVDRYNFLDSDDIEKFNSYLYQDKRTALSQIKNIRTIFQNLSVKYIHPQILKYV